MRPTLRVLFRRFALLVLLLAARPAAGQNVAERDAELADRPITAVLFTGIDAEEERLARNNVRTAVGDPYDGQTVRDDVARLYGLGRFLSVTARARLLEDGTVELTYALAPQPRISAVQTVGNRAVPDQDLRALIQQVPGGPRDQYLIEKAKRDIKELYKRKGFYLTEVSVDESELEERGLLLFNVIEGPRVRIKAVEFEGAETFSETRLRAEVKTRTHVFILRAGTLDEETMAADKGRIATFYKDRGYLDVRVGHTVELSPDNTEAKVVYHVAEGPRFRLRSVKAEKLGRPGVPIELFTDQQIAALLDIKSGDVYSLENLGKSLDRVKEAYGQLGYLDVRVEESQIRTQDAEVDLLLEIDEGRRYKVGLIRINGNFLTKDKVVRRLLRVEPGRPFDAAALEESRLELLRTRLFNDVRITVQDPDPLEPQYRDLLVEVLERNTGSVNFGLAVGSDSGLFGDFSVNQNNFDIADFPASFRELVAGRAFRGAGQRFSMVLRPGSELFQYSVSITEPHLFDTDNALGVSGIYRTRDFDDYEEERLTGSVSLSRAFGEVWQAGVRGRWEEVELSEIEPDAPLEVFADRGPDSLGAIGVTLTRTTLDAFTRPGRGSRLEFAFDSFGLFGGDIDFHKASLDYTVYLTIDEDFLGRKSTFRVDARLGYIFGGRAPTYERFYLGGRSFRAFDFREVSPKGIRADTLEPGDDPVGGDWLFFVGGQYEFPLFEETITGVVFVDSGTVRDDPGFGEYRVGAGFGVRLYIPQLGPVPIAFDFGFPVLKEDGDDTRVLSFSAELPF